MWLIEDINPSAPKWIRQGIGGYEAKLMTQDFIKSSTDFETMKGFQFSYMMVEFVLNRYGIDALN